MIAVLLTLVRPFTLLVDNRREREFIRGYTAGYVAGHESRERAEAARKMRLASSFEEYAALVRQGRS